MGGCPNPIGYVTKVKGENIGLKLPVNCKRRSCPHCGKVTKKRVLDRVNYGFKGSRVRGMTLTELKHPDNVEHENISKHWARLRANLAKMGYHPKFFRVTEFKPRECEFCRANCEHKGINQACVLDGTQYRHYHVLINAYIPQSVISNAWYKATNHTAYVVWVNASDIMRGAGYLSKYLVKQMTAGQFKFHEKGYSFSQGSFPLVVYEELLDRNGRLMGEIPFNVDGTVFKNPVPGEWEFTYDTGWIYSEDAEGNDNLAFNENYKRFIEFMERVYPWGK